MEGLSSLTVVGWHLACALVTGYLIANNEVIMVIFAFAMQTATFMIIETQFILYRNSDSMDADCDGSNISDRDRVRRASAVLVMSAVISACTVAGSWWICSIGSSLVSLLTGGVVPSVLFGVGYILQISEIVQSGSGEGVSLGLIALDTSGCVCGMATVLITSGDPGAVAVFLVNIMFHAVLASMIFIYPGPPSELDSSEDITVEDAEAVEGGSSTSPVVKELPHSKSSLSPSKSSSTSPGDPVVPGPDTMFYNKAVLATSSGRVHDGDGTAKQRPAHVRQCCSTYPIRG